MRALDVEAPAPHAIRLVRDRRHEGGEELIAHCHPFRASDTLLIIGPRSALPQTEKAAAAAKPSHVDSFRPSENSNVLSDAPNQTRVRRIIFRMNRRRRTQGYKVAAALIWLVSPVLEINIHFDHVVVLVLWRFFEEELLSNNDLLGRRVLESHSR